MQTQLQPLVALQAVEQRIAVLEAEITALPKKMAAQDAKLAQARERLAKVQAALKQEEAARRRMEDDIRDQRAKAAKYSAQTNTVKTNEQLHALQHEIGFAESEVARIEDRELESMEATDRLEADKTRAEQELQEQSAVVDQEKSAALKVSARDQEELKKLRAERAELRSAADADLLADYDRIAKARKTGLAEVREQECQGCHVRLRPAQWQHLREGTLMHCESCGRLLYYDEGSDQKLAAKAAGQWDIP
jgi:predicted  nucleic acid-binding Zn-ribbon protein